MCATGGAHRVERVKEDFGTQSFVFTKVRTF